MLYSTLSRSQYDFTLPQVSFTSSGYHKHITLTFNPTVRKTLNSGVTNTCGLLVFSVREYPFSQEGPQGLVHGDIYEWYWFSCVSWHCLSLLFVYVHLVSRSAKCLTRMLLRAPTLLCPSLCCSCWQRTTMKRYVTTCPGQHVQSVLLLLLNIWRFINLYKYWPNSILISECYFFLTFSPGHPPTVTAGESYPGRTKHGSSQRRQRCPGWSQTTGQETEDQAYMRTWSRLTRHTFIH